MQPDPKKESAQKQLAFRLEQAAQVARAQLKGYSKEDIEDIWITIKSPLVYDDVKEEKICKSTNEHPPVERLFEISIDIDQYTNSILEGKIEPADICAVYALKTVEYAKSVKDPFVVCIDAWRALSFMPRANYLQERISVQESHIIKTKKMHNASMESKDIKSMAVDVFAIYEKNYSYFQKQKESGDLSPQAPENIAIGSIKKLRYSYQYVAQEIHYLLQQEGIIEEDVDESFIDKIPTMLKRYDKDRKQEKKEEATRAKVFVVADQAFRWPLKKPALVNADNEIISGEIPEYEEGSKKILKEQIKEWLKEKDFRDSIEYRITKL